MNALRHLGRLLAVAVVAIAAAACSEVEETEFILSVRNTAVDGDKGSQFVEVSTTSSQMWTLTLTDGSGVTPDWATISPSSGVGSKSSIAFSWTSNGTGESRTVVITGVCGNQTASVTITQAAYEFMLSVRNTAVDGDEGSQLVEVSTGSGQTWTLTLTDGSGVTPDWATIAPASGVGSKSSVALSWTRNDTDFPRTVIVTGVYGSQSASVTIIQAPYESDGGGNTPFPEEITADPVPSWLELPATDNDKLYFITHDSEVNKCGRNFSYYWDVDNLVAHWVAYPLNNKLAGSGGRTDEWEYDPKLPKSAQPELYKGYKMGSTGTVINGGASWWDRGHQCPSADRLAYKDNIQTFYFTNMTPQDPYLNQNMWAALETRVRDWSKVFDTLYVATGCVVKGSDAYAYDNKGKRVTAPVGYYKALLGYQKSRSVGITSQTYGYTGVAFYFENRNYSGTNYMTQAMTIDELEILTGEDFFVNLPKVIDKERADKVESTHDNYWWNGK